MGIRFGTWAVKSLYRIGSLVTAAKELLNYELDLMRVQEARWEGGGTNQQENIHFSTEKGMRIMN
jgi:hypothetical protein